MIEANRKYMNWICCAYFRDLNLVKALRCKGCE
jgi:hypothetical protein